jgi:hypothetical protein
VFDRSSSSSVAFRDLCCTFDTGGDTNRAPQNVPEALTLGIEMPLSLLMRINETIE